jgi:16S rRNA (guanine527-N7)-methyltransferase
MTVAAEGLNERIARAIAGAAVPAGAVQALGSWLALLGAWNARIDLTAARTEDELVDLMVADALVLAARIPPGARVVDVGSGAGAPGLPLAIVRPDVAVTLVEPMEKRVAFLRTVVGTVFPAGATRPIVVRGRGEDVARRGERFDVAVSRATLGPGAWLSLGGELAPEGAVWVLLAREEPPRAEGFRVEEDVRYRWPLTGASLRAVRFGPASRAG